MRIALALLAAALALAGCARPPAPTAAAPTPASAAVGRAFPDMALRRPAPPGHGNVDAAETASAKRPDDPAAQRALGLAYYAAGAYPAAANLLQKASVLAPRDALAWLYLGYARMGTGEIEKAVEALERATALPGLDRTRQAQGWLEMGNCYFQALRQDPKAAEAFRKSLAIRPEEGGAALALGTWHAQAGRSAEARRYFVQAAQNLPRGPERAAAYACLGRLAEEAKQTASAQPFYQKALADDPNNAWAKVRSKASPEKKP